MRLPHLLAVTAFAFLNLIPSPASGASNSFEEHERYGKSKTYSIPDTEWTISFPSTFQPPSGQPSSNNFGSDVEKSLAQVRPIECLADPVKPKSNYMNRFFLGEMKHPGKAISYKTTTKTFFYVVAMPEGTKECEGGKTAALKIRYTWKGDPTEAAIKKHEAIFLSMIETLGVGGSSGSAQPKEEDETAVVDLSGDDEEEDDDDDDDDEDDEEEEEPPLDTLIIERVAGFWKPVSVVRKGDPDDIKVLFIRKMRRVRVKTPPQDEDDEDEGKKPKTKYVFRGSHSKTVTVVRSYLRKDHRLLVVSIYPAALVKMRMHIELHFKAVRGYLEAAEVKAIRVLDTKKAGRRDDSIILRAKGADFVEEIPGRASLRVAAAEARVGVRSLNAGRLRRSRFFHTELGLVNINYYALGVVSGDRILGRLRKKSRKRPRRRRRR